MRFFWLFPFLTPLVLAACDPRPHSEFDPESVFASLLEGEGPQVKGVNDTLLESARQAESKRQYNRALQFYQQLIDKDKTSKVYLLGLADNLRRMNQLDEANNYYNQILGRDSEDVDALEGKGLCLLNRGEFENASDYFQKVMARDGKRWRTLNAVGILFVMKGMLKEAEAYYAEAAKLNPGEPAVLNNYGLTLALSDKYDQAITALTQAGDRLDKGDTEKRRADLNLALVYGLSGDMARAEEVAGRHLQEAALNNNLGFYAYLADNQELAKAYLNNALAGSPVFYEKAWKNLEIVGGSKVERSQFNAGDQEKISEPAFKKAPFATASPPKKQEIPVAAPVTPVSGSKDLPAMISDKPAPAPEKPAAKVVKGEKNSAAQLPGKGQPRPEARVDIYPAVPVAPLLEDGVRPVSMSVDMGTPAAMKLPAPQPETPLQQSQVAAPTPVFAAPPPARMDIYLPSEMGIGEVKQQLQTRPFESLAIPSTENVMKPPVQTEEEKRKKASELIIFQANELENKKSPAASEPADPQPSTTEAPPVKVAVEPVPEPSPQQRAAEPLQDLAPASGGIVGTPVPEYQEEMPPRQSTIDYFKSIF